MREIDGNACLINDGFDIGTGRDPYKNFEFSRLATA
jgi:hypothetical protein